MGECYYSQGGMDQHRNLKLFAQGYTVCQVTELEIQSKCPEVQPPVLVQAALSTELQRLENSLH